MENDKELIDLIMTAVSRYESAGDRLFALRSYSEARRLFLCAQREATKLSVAGGDFQPLFKRLYRKAIDCLCAMKDDEMIE